MEGTHSALALQQVGKVRVGQGGGSHKVTWVYDMTMLCSLANTANRNTHTRTHTHTHMHAHTHTRACTHLKVPGVPVSPPHGVCLAQWRSPRELELPCQLSCDGLMQQGRGAYHRRRRNIHTLICADSLNSVTRSQQQHTLRSYSVDIK